MVVWGEWPLERFSQAPAMGYRPPMTLTDDELERYARHIVLREVGGPGQAKLKSARVLVVGAGGLGSPVILYLAAAGVGTIGSPMPTRCRCPICSARSHTAPPMPDGGRQNRRPTAPRRSTPASPSNRTPLRVTPENAMDLIGRYDILSPTGRTISRPAFFSTMPAFSRRRRWYRQLSPNSTASSRPTKRMTVRTLIPAIAACFPNRHCPARCHPAPKPGILGAAAGVMGTLQALEVIKEILGLWARVSPGQLLIYDALATRFRKVRMKPDPACRLCGADAAINAL